MSNQRYNYSTSPRKIEAEPKRKRTNDKKRNNLRVVENVQRQEIKLSKEQKRKQRNMTFSVIVVFVMLLAISYRNSQINEKFSEIQELKGNLALLQKENQQLEVNIEDSLNFNNIEKQAKEKLGMQKLTTNQTIYVDLPKKDYTEVGSQQVILEEKSWFEEFIEKIFN